jgi:hypothetical protein
MANIAGAVENAVSSLFQAPAGNGIVMNAVTANLGQVPAIPMSSIVRGNVSPDLLEQSVALQYPAVVIYCEKLANTLKEKFRTFSGTVTAAIEVRYTQDQIQNMQAQLEIYVAAACQILDNNRGDWGGGLFYRGGYQVTFGPAKRGGRNFLQTAKVTVEVDVSE